ncbi:hypothetical protein RclHR1_07450012 [Rhizophagus clarus]|uniref:Uncharacterized protein n=1 Tax=Rhizophagus clarus TaxID=94130 RepID=A0A2Z6RX95_9GLOM|nr:hypothetical protein RclHR1_07450012 [Rhizophagus clarus]GES83951.1 hypothetical protein RCL_jg19491.t1 [Rhizophagus clarus]
MNKCPNFKYLDISSIKDHQIFNLPEARLRFESLYELEYDTSIDPSYFNGFSNISQCIQRLTIIGKGVNLGVVKLIEV